MITQQDKFEKYWLFQLSTRTKKKVISFVKRCDFGMNGFKTHADLNILPLGSYGLLIEMDWLEKHTVILNCYDKRFSCLDYQGNTIVVKGIPMKVTIREILALQMKMYVCKGCKFFAVYIMDDEEK